LSGPVLYARHASFPLAASSAIEPAAHAELAAAVADQHRSPTTNGAIVIVSPR
jgi:hypothetical protein